MSLFKGLFVVTSVILAFVFILFSYTANAQSATINYQGKLSDNTGAAVVDGDYNVRFWLFQNTGQATTSAIWTEELTGANQVSVVNGLFSVMLGSTTPLSSVDFNQTLYLGVEIGGTGAATWDGEMLPRKPLGTVPAAFQAEEASNAQTLGGIATTSFLRSDTADSMDEFLALTAGGSATDFLVTGTATTTNLVVGSDFISSLTGAGLFISGNALSVSSSSLNITLDGLGDTNLSGPADGDLFSYNGSEWVNVATSSLGFDVGASDFLSLTDTPGSFNANRLLFTNTGGTALTDSAELIFDQGPLVTVFNPFDISTATFDEIALDVSSEDTAPLAIIFNDDGTVLYVLGSDDDDISAYTLSTAYDVSTAVFDSVALDVSGEDGLPTDMIFNDDGTVLYVLGIDGDDINAYTLPTPYDIASYTSGTSIALSVAAQDITPTDMLFNDDGTVLYVQGSNVDRTIAYTLSTAYDISTASFSSFVLFPGAQEINPIEILFNNTGTILYLMGSDGDDINAYPLSTPYDISSYSSGTSVVLNIGLQEADPRSMIFNDDGTVLYVLGFDGDDINSYILSSEEPNGANQLFVDADFRLSGSLFDSNNSTGTAGMILQTTNVGTQWVATSSLGIGGGASDFLSLTDTPGSFTANRLLFQTGSAVTDSANLTYDGSLFNAPTFDAASSTIFSQNGIRMFWSTSTTDSIAIGEGSGNAFNDIGFRNVAIGYQSAFDAGSTTASDYLTAVGYQSGYRNTGDILSAYGYLSSFENSGSNVNAYGYLSAYQNQGNDVLAIGREAARENTANAITAIGWQSGERNSGLRMIGLGVNSGFENTGDYLVSVGDQSGFQNTGTGVTAVGYQSAYQNSGLHLVAFGQEAGDSNSGNYSTMIGYRSGLQNSGEFLVSLGYQSAYQNTADNVTAIGREALRYRNATNTVALGNQAGRGLNTTRNSTGVENSLFLGYRSGYLIDSGSNNILIGYQAADSLSTGSNNLIIGYDVEAPSNTGSNQLNIGNLIFGTGVDGTGTTLSSGNIGIGTTSPYAKLSVDGDLALTGGIYDNSASLGTAGMVMQTTGSGVQWVATSSLGIGGSGASDFLSLTDTPGSFTANRLMFTNTGGTALTDSANLTFDGNQLALLGSQQISQGQPVGIGSISDGVNGAEVLNGAFDVIVRGDYAYVSARDDGGFQILNVANPANITSVGSTTNGFDGTDELLNASGLAVVGDFAYITSGVSDGVQVIDISDPTSPVAAGSISDNINGADVLNGARDIAVVGHYAYVVSADDNGVEVLDISDPANIFGVGAITDNANGATRLADAHNIVIKGDYAYVTSRTENAVQVLDISDPANPTGVAEVTDGFSGTNELEGAWGVDISGNYLYVTGRADGGLQIIDISDPLNPTGVGSITDGANGATTMANALTVKVRGNYAYVVSELDNGVQVIDISSSTNPVGVYAITDGANGADELSGPIGMDIVGNKMYVTTLVDDGLQIIDLGGLTVPTAEIGSLLVNQVKGKDLFIVNGQVDGQLNVGAELSVVGGASFSTLVGGGFVVADTSGVLATTSLAETFFTLTGAGELFDGGVAQLERPVSVAISGDYAFVTSSNNDSVQSINIADPNNPVAVGSVIDGFNGTTELDGAYHIAIAGNYAYISSITDDGVQVLDISDPANMFGVGAITDGANGSAELDSAAWIAVQGNYAYVAADADDGVQVLDISDPTNPVGVGSITDGANGATTLDGAIQIVVDGNYAYVTARFDNGVQVLDISDPTNPVGVGSITDGANGAVELLGARGISKSGNYLYVAAGSDNGVQVIDVSDPLNPTGVGSIEEGVGGADELVGAISTAVTGNYLFVTSYTDNGVQVLDISDPTNPTAVTSISDGANGATALANAQGVAISGNYAYVTGFIDNGFQVLDLGGLVLPTAEIGSLLTDRIDVDSIFGQNANFNNGLSVGRNAMINGALTIQGTASSSLLAGNTNPSLVVLSGNVGIGTTSPYAKLSIDGNLALTGGIYDNSASLGTVGMVMQTTGTGVQWVATSSLGFVDTGATDFLSLTDTPGSFSANRLMFTNTAGTALTDSADLTFGFTPGAVLDTFDVSTASFVDSFSVVSQDNSLGGLEFSSDGFKMFMLGQVGQDVNEYDLSTAFDVSTASFVDSFGVSGEDTIPTGLAFSNDGFKMFVLGDIGNDVIEYDLSTAFDVSTASFVDSFVVVGQDGSPFDVEFSSDGFKMFVLGGVNDDVFEYDLSTAFDVSTASFVDSFSVSAQETESYGLAFSNDGFKMFVTGFSGDDVNEYDLSTAFDVSTASFVDSFSVSAQESIPLDVEFSEDGEKMFVLGNAGVDVNEYDVGTAGSDIGRLTLNGDLDLTGGIYDNSASLGTAGMVMQTTGSGVQWVATSTLGIGGGSSVTFGTDNQLPFMNSGGTDFEYSSQLTFDGSLFSISTSSNSVLTVDATAERVAIGTTTAASTATLAVQGSQEILPGQLRGVGSITDGTNGADTLDVANSITVSGNYAYVVSDPGGVQILDISDPTNPVGVGSITDGQNGADMLDSTQAITVSGNYAYVTSAGSDNGVQILDISDAANPVGVGAIQFGDPFDFPRAITVSGNYAYTTQHLDQGIQIFDISDPTNPVIVADIITSVSSDFELRIAKAIAIKGNYAYVTIPVDDSVQIFDISDPTNPVGVGSITDGASGADTLVGSNGIAISGNYAYVAAFYESGVQILDISDPTNPVGVGSITDGQNGADRLINPNNIVVSGNYAYVVTSGGDGGVQILDISDPTNPVGVGSITDGASGADTLGSPQDIVINGNYAYVTSSNDDGVQILDLGGFSAPTAEIGTLLANRIDTDTIQAQSANLTGGLNVGQNAMINGALTIQGTASSSLLAGNTNPSLVIGSGNVGIGTTSPTQTLSIDGTMQLTGLLYDSLGSAGSAGMVLQRGSTGIEWVATSTLGIGGGAGDGEVLTQRFTSYPTTWNALSGLSGSTTVGVSVDLREVLYGSIQVLEDGVVQQTVSAGDQANLVLDPASSLSVRTGGSYDPSSYTSGTSIALSVAGQEAFPTAMLFNNDGTVLYVMGGDQDINAYPLDTAYDIASYTSGTSIALSVAGQEAVPYAMLFNNDGTILYVLGSTGKDINAYPLDTAYDISSYTSGTSIVLDVSGQELVPRAMLFNNDGTILYVMGSTGEDINAYPLDTPYDISSYTSGTSVALSVTGQDTNPTAMLFNNDGTILYVMGTTGDDINAYPLPTPYDISSYTSGTSIALDVSGQENTPFAMLFNDDGTILYVLGATGDDINAYPLDTFSGTANVVITTEAGTSGADLAELYPTADTAIEAGDIVSFTDESNLEIDFATADSELVLAGIVSTEPGLLLQDEESGGDPRPLALSGRVPAKVSLENGPILPGDRITPSSVPGVGMKANMFDPSVGVALTEFADIAASTTVGRVTVFIDLQSGLNANSLTASLFEGATTSYMFTPLASLATTSASSTDQMLSEPVVVSIWSRLGELAGRFVDGILSLAGLTVGSQEAAAGITIYDVVTGDPYCSVVANGETMTLEGTCEEADFDDLDTNSSSETPPQNNTGEADITEPDTDTTEEPQETDPVETTDTSTTTNPDVDPEPTATTTEPVVDQTGTSTEPVVEIPEPEVETATTTEEVVVSDEPETVEEETTVTEEVGAMEPESDTSIPEEAAVEEEVVTEEVTPDEPVESTEDEPTAEPTA